MMPSPYGYPVQVAPTGQPKSQRKVIIAIAVIITVVLVVVILLFASGTGMPERTKVHTSSIGNGLSVYEFRSDGSGGKVVRTSVECTNGVFVNFTLVANANRDAYLSSHDPKLAIIHLENGTYATVDGNKLTGDPSGTYCWIVENGSLQTAELKYSVTRK